MSELIARLVEVFSTPAGTFVLSLAILGIVGVLLHSWFDARILPRRSDARAETLKPVAPPLLSPKMMRPGASSAPARPEANLRLLLLALVAIVAVILVLQWMDRPATRTADRISPAPIAEVEPTFVEGVGLVEAGLDGSAVRLSDCKDGPINEVGLTVRKRPKLVDEGGGPLSRSFILCGSGQAARFDMVGFSHQGDTLVDPVWHERQSTLVAADNLAKPYFAFDRKSVDIIAGHGMDVEDYDVFLAVGIAGYDVPNTVAETRAAKRALELGQYVRDELRDGLPARDCDSDAKIYAVALGGYRAGSGVIAAADDPATDQPAPPEAVRMQSAPLLFGIQFDPRTLPKDRDPDALVADFLASQGAAMTGYDLRHFGTPERIFAGHACTRAAG